jgi:hypothetical protein
MLVQSRGAVLACPVRIPGVRKAALLGAGCCAAGDERIGGNTRHGRAIEQPQLGIAVRRSAVGYDNCVT